MSKRQLIIILLVLVFAICLLLSLYNIFKPPDININTCSRETLESLPGIGEVLSLRIIQNRPYADIWELDEVKGIGPGIINKIKSEVTCE
jgi:DNA uptake protein ComE-like DNA-binding protein